MWCTDMDVVGRFKRKQPLISGTMLHIVKPACFKNNSHLKGDKTDNNYSAP